MGEVIATYRSRHWHSLEEGIDLLLNNVAVVGLWLLMGLAIGPGPFWMLYAPVMAGSAALFLCIFSCSTTSRIPTPIAAAAGMR